MPVSNHILLLNSVSDKKIGSDGAITLAEAITSNTFLQELEISSMSCLGLTNLNFICR